MVENTTARGDVTSNMVLIIEELVVETQDTAVPRQACQLVGRHNRLTGRHKWESVQC